MPTIQEALQQAVDLQNQGKTGEATAYYEAILKVDPDQPDALHLLGLVASTRHDYSRAEELIRRALTIVPESSVFYGNLGVVLRRAGRVDEAIEAYHTAIELDPSSADAYFNLGKSLKLKGDIQSAEQAFRKSTELDPHKHTAWLSLMNVYADRKQLQTAIEIGQAGLKHCSRSSQLHMNMGAVIKRLGKIEEVIAFYRRAVELAPNDVEPICRLANTLVDRHMIDEGQELNRRAQRLDPNNVHTLTSAGILQSAAGNTETAVQLFRKAISLYPEHGTAYVHLALALRKQGELTQALEALEKALAFDSIIAEAQANKAGILMCLGRHEEAESCFMNAIHSREDFRDSHANLLMCQQYSPHRTPEEILREHREWNDLYAADLVRSREFDNNQDPKRKLRVGFTSGDLGTHPVGYFTVRLFESLGGDDLDTFIYSDRPGRDPIAARVEKSVSSWTDVASMSDEALSDRIRSDKIDILFDLAGHTASNRLMIFARRSAPIQITWAGYVGTTGLSEMDYLLADKYHVPVDKERNYREKVLRMPHGYVTYDPPLDAPDVSPLPTLKSGYITFASICNPAKVNPQVLEVWSSILQQVPDSQLLLCYTGWPDIGNQRRVREALCGSIAPERLIFQQRSGAKEVLGVYQNVDIALDTFPYSGGLTTCEALWMGVPTITFPGDRFASRHSYSHLLNVGLHECIAEDKASYVSRAVQFAHETKRLQALRATLRSRMATSPLCNGLEFARDFTRLMREVWNRWCTE